MAAGSVLHETDFILYPGSTTSCQTAFNSLTSLKFSFFFCENEHYNSTYLAVIVRTEITYGNHLAQVLAIVDKVCSLVY